MDAPADHSCKIHYKKLPMSVAHAVVTHNVKSPNREHDHDNVTHRSGEEVSYLSYCVLLPTEVERISILLLQARSTLIVCNTRSILCLPARGILIVCNTRSILCLPARGILIDIQIPILVYLRTISFVDISK